MTAARTASQNRIMANQPRHAPAAPPDVAARAGRGVRAGRARQEEMLTFGPIVVIAFAGGLPPPAEGEEGSFHLAHPSGEGAWGEGIMGRSLRRQRRARP